MAMSRGEPPGRACDTTKSAEGVPGNTLLEFGIAEPP